MPFSRDPLLSRNPRAAIARAGAALLAVLLAAGAVLVGAAPARAAENDVLYALVNEARWAQGLAGLVRNSSLEAVAQAWASQLGASGALSHNPEVGTQIPGGWSSWGENVAQGHPSGAAMHEGWMNSSGHRANILGQFTDVGIAFVVAGGTTWGVEVFATYPGHAGPAPPAAPAPPAPAEPAPAPPAPAPPAEASPAPTPSAPEPSPSPSPGSSRSTSPTPSPQSASPGTGDPAAATAPLPFALSAAALAVIAAVGTLLWRHVAARRSGSGARRRHRLG